MIGKLEALVARVLEGTAARLFRVRLQPVQIAKRLIRAMEANQSISVDRTLVPNSYLVVLSPADYAQFERFKRSLERDLAEALATAARQRGLALVSFPRVEIERSEEVAPGDMRVGTALVDESGAEVSPEEVGEELRPGRTQVLDRQKLAAAQPKAPRAALELVEEGRGVAVGAATCTLGRSPENDVVIDDRRVSRRHAEIRVRLGRHTLYDLGSTNGTFVNGKRISEVVLSDGDRITLGAATLVYRLEE